MAIDPVTGQILGGAVAGGIGGLFGGGGGAGKSDNTKEAFTGFNTSGGLFDPSLIKGVGSGNDTLDFGISGPIGDLQNQLVGGAAGLFGQQGNAAQAGQLGSNFLGGLGSTDPLELQQALYGQLSPQLINQQNQDFFDMEGRLFGQGRLGSTGGNQQLDTLFDSQADARNRLLFDSFGQAQQAQQQQANIGSMLSQLDPQLQGLFSGIGNQQLLAALGIQGGAQETTRLGSLVGGAGRVPEFGGSPNIGSGGFFDALGTGLMTGGINQITGGVDNLFAPNVGSPGGPGSGAGGSAGLLNNNMFSNGFLGGGNL